MVHRLLLCNVIRDSWKVGKENARRRLSGKLHTSVGHSLFGEGVQRLGKKS